MKTLFIFFLTTISLVAQDTVTKPFGRLDVGIEFQGYPTGIIPGVRIEAGLHRRNSISLRIGYNWIRHGNFGVHEDERGDGWGFTLGYRHYFGKRVMRGFFLGVKNDFWFNTLDWRDSIGKPTEITGTTRIVVIQPTAEAGFNFVFARHRIAIAPTIAFGVEINAITNGAPVGQGTILLWGFTASYRFKTRK